MTMANSGSGSTPKKEIARQKRKLLANRGK